MLRIRSSGQRHKQYCSSGICDVATRLCTRRAAAGKPDGAAYAANTDCRSGNRNASSAIRSFGLQASAMAIITRCRMPPESWCG